LTEHRFRKFGDFSLEARAKEIFVAHLDAGGAWTVRSLGAKGGRPECSASGGAPREAARRRSAQAAPEQLRRRSSARVRSRSRLAGFWRACRVDLAGFAKGWLAAVAGMVFRR
jgi:hypothetical protein